MDERFENEVFDKLRLSEKNAFLKELGKKLGVKFISLHNYQKWERTSTSGEFCIDGYNFVFLPRTETVLGWDGSIDGITEKEKENIFSDFEEFGIDSRIEDYLDGYLSRRRKVVVGPMLVGKNLRGYKDLKLENSQIGYDSFLALLKEKGYSLTNSDEWEYLAGGDQGSIFPWGNGVMENTEKLLGPSRQKGVSSFLEDENHLGLHIAYDPYTREIILSSRYETRGGDGGCALCGGLCQFLGFLSISPHYVDCENSNETFNTIYGGWRPVIHLNSLL